MVHRREIRIICNQGSQGFPGVLGAGYEIMRSQASLQLGNSACSQCSTRSGYHCTSKSKKEDFIYGGMSYTGEAQAYGIFCLVVMVSFGGYIH